MTTRKIMIAGLGNPTPEYADTYHNVGAWCVRTMAGDTAPSRPDPLFIAYSTPRRVYIVPCTFMNDSGNAIAAALKYFRMPVSRLVVVHDDSDLTVGTSKLSFAQGSAGHNGVSSIIETVGTNQFWRVRIGIRPPETEASENRTHRLKAGTFVLSPIPKKYREVLQGVFGDVEELIVKLTEKETD